MITQHPVHLPLPVSWQECRQRGWQEYDILLITGDAYVDHPSFGVALIGRLLENQGFRVAVLQQPRINNDQDFKQFPPPRLFCGITAGNLDSIVANYTGNGKVRETDNYSSDGNPYRLELKEKSGRRRPDRATIVYSAIARSSFPHVPIVLGGIEASLRRFVHYDFKQAKLRGSILTDAKGDILVYGMGERAITEIAKRCQQTSPDRPDLSGINGTCLRLTELEFGRIFASKEHKSDRKNLFLPAYGEILHDKRLFLDAEIEIDRHARAYSPRLVYQKQQSHWIVQYPAAQPLSSKEFDELYDLPFTRRPHPENQVIPALQMIQDSVTIVRGCPGNCAFCAISRHQGPVITSRSNESISRECCKLAQSAAFKGTISDLGGPTANLFGSNCKIGGCKKRDCLYPRQCPNLVLDEDRFIELLDAVRNVAGIKHVFISSGLRMEPLLHTPRLLKELLLHHTPGALKIAPEHTEKSQLQLMHKEHPELLQRFVEKCRRTARSYGKNIELTPYVIISHPGSTVVHAEKLVEDLQILGLKARQFQDFTPTPGTISTAMYVTGLDPETRKPIVVPRNQSERMAQRKILEGAFHPGQKKAVTQKSKRKQQSRNNKKGQR